MAALEKETTLSAQLAAPLLQWLASFVLSSVGPPALLDEVSFYAFARILSAFINGRNLSWRFSQN